MCIQRALCRLTRVPRHHHRLAPGGLRAGAQPRDSLPPAEERAGHMGHQRLVVHWPAQRRLRLLQPLLHSLLETSTTAWATLPHPSTVHIRELLEGGNVPSGTDERDADAEVTAIQERVRDRDETRTWGAPGPAAEDTPRQRPCPAAGSSSGGGAGAPPPRVALGQAAPRAPPSSAQVATQSSSDDDWVEEHFRELQALFLYPDRRGPIAACAAAEQCSHDRCGVEFGDARRQRGPGSWLACSWLDSLRSCA